MEEDVDGDLADLETLNYDDLDSVSKLQKSQRFADIMQVCFKLTLLFSANVLISKTYKSLYAPPKLYCFTVLLIICS